MSIEKLKEYDKQYDIGKSTISDLEYDNLKDKMKSLYPDDSYFKNVGVDSRIKVRLPYVLGSLNKSKADGSCMKWLKKQSGSHIIITPKLDGVSILVNYYNGVVNKAYLRGDGEFGQEITIKARRFIKPIEEMSSIWVRGEVLLDHLPEGYKNKRNAVAGIINDEENELQYKLKVMFYEYINTEIEIETERLKYMLTSGLSVIDYWLYTKDDITENELVERLKYFKELYSQYNIDGLVLTDDNSVRENVKYPDNKIAFKVNQDAVTTTVLAIEYNTSRKGRIIPLIYIDPVDIDGSTISKVTAHNCKYIQDHKIVVGLKVGVYKAGDVIPFLVLYD